MGFLGKVRKQAVNTAGGRLNHGSGLGTLRIAEPHPREKSDSHPIESELEQTDDSSSFDI
jgi:hypothetical protein